MSAEKQRPLLIVEDDPALQKQLRWAFDQYETLTAGDRENAVALIRRHQPPVVTMDLGLPPDADSVSEGFKLLEDTLSIAPETKVIVVEKKIHYFLVIRFLGLRYFPPFQLEIRF